MTASLQATGVTVTRGGQTLLTEASLTLCPGQVVALVGPNGSGKSSFMRVLLGADDAAAGTVALAGRPLRDWSRRERARLLASVPQESGLQFPVPVAGVVAMGRYAYGGTRGEPHQDPAVASALARCDLGELAYRPFTSLSGGERRRVLLARALAAEPQILLMDEPTANLDIAHALACLEDVRRVAAEGCAVLIALHDLSQAAQVADQITIIDGQRLLPPKAPSEALSPPVIRRVFGVEVQPGGGVGYRLPSGGGR